MNDTNYLNLAFCLIPLIAVTIAMTIYDCKIVVRELRENSKKQKNNKNKKWKLGNK